MKKLFLALAGIFGFAWLRRRTAVPAGPDPAEELRAKLAEKREPEPQPEPEPEPAADVDVGARRSEVHERARQAMEDLAPPDAPQE